MEAFKGKYLVLHLDSDPNTGARIETVNIFDKSQEAADFYYSNGRTCKAAILGKPMDGHYSLLLSGETGLWENLVYPDRIENIFKSGYSSMPSKRHLIKLISEEDQRAGMLEIIGDCELKFRKIS
jgi:hypothetical protein